MTTVGVYEAKTQLPRLIDEVAKGARVTITKHGVPVAMLVPAAGVRRVAPDDVINALQAFRKGRRLGGRARRARSGPGRRVTGQISRGRWARRGGFRQQA